MLHGYSLPRTPRGVSSLVLAPPWHFAGDALAIEFEADPAAVSSFLPDGLAFPNEGVHRPLWLIQGFSSQLLPAVLLVFKSPFKHGQKGRKIQGLEEELLGSELDGPHGEFDPSMARKEDDGYAGIDGLQPG